MLDTKAERVFDDLAAVAALVCGVPISLVTLIDEDRQWFKASIGMGDVAQTPRDVAFCDHTIRTDEILEIADATADRRFADNPLVTGSPNVRFYAGAPLRLSDGARVGALCVVDDRPRELEPWQRDALSKLSSALCRTMEYRRTALEFADSEARFRALSEASPLGVFSTDPEGSCTYVNERWEAIMGLPAAQAIGTGWSRIVHPDDLEALSEEWRRTTSRRLDLDTTFRVVRSDGSRAHVRALSRPVYAKDGELTGHVGSVEDITEGVIRQNELAEAHERIGRDVEALRALSDELDEQRELLEVTLQSINDAVITTDGSGRIAWLNPVAERLTGHASADSLGRPLGEVFRIVDGTSGEALPDPVVACLGGDEVRSGADRAALDSATGRRLDVEYSAAPIRRPDARPLGVVLVFRDVTEQRRLSAELSHRATHDALTGLVNRLEFEACLERSLAEAREGSIDGVLMYIDLDNFKIVNDSCGHAVGDRLLREAAELIGDAVRGTDTVARIGGDEFAAILPGCDTSRACEVGRAIRDRMGEYRFVHGGRRFRVGTSIGIAPIDGRWSGVAAVMQAADSACYEAKRAGRNRVITWAETDRALRVRSEHTRWAARLEEALDDDAFELHAQRIETVAGPSGQLHAEVLVRLRAEGGELVPPGAFLPAAERYHLAARIDRWVLRRAIDQLVAIPDLSGLSMLCVNLSGQSIGDRDFHRDAIAMLSEAGDGIRRRLCLELTETAAVTAMADAVSFAERVRALGLRIALDDFGAGASSFGYLKTLPVDVLKIDGQFIQAMMDEPLDEAAVHGFVHVARVMGVRTVAEYVDRPEILGRVRELGIDFAQGFLLHRPEPLARVLEGLGREPGSETLRKAS